MSEVEFRAHTEGVIAALEAEAQFPVGDHKAPDGGGRQTDGSFDKYVVVYRIPGGSRGGNLDGAYGDAELIYQVTCVGSSARQAEWLADRVDEALLGGVSVSGRRVRVIPHDNPAGAREDDVTPSIFSATPRYRLMTTPSSQPDPSS